MISGAGQLVQLTQGRPSRRQDRLAFAPVDRSLDALEILSGQAPRNDVAEGDLAFPHHGDVHLGEAREHLSGVVLHAGAPQHQRGIRKRLAHQSDQLAHGPEGEGHGADPDHLGPGQA